MPSPFPGMDPYLEEPILWPGLHQRLITHIGDTLNALMPPHYVADIGERLYVVQPEHSVYPDTVVVQHPCTPAHPEAHGERTSATMVSDQPLILTVEPVEVRETFVEILSLREEGRIVTVLEILSPSNKVVGSEGRQQYLTKQREVLESQTHLIEIDLLRTGAHTVAPPRERLLRHSTWDYLVSLHRGGRNRFEVWTFTVRQRLPRFSVPLANGDPDVVLDLQAVFDRCYDAGGYARRVDYRREPPTPLQGDDATWAAALLREKGLRN